MRNFHALNLNIAFPKGIRDVKQTFHGLAAGNCKPRQNAGARDADLIKAPGKLTLTGLELSDNALFAGIAQRALLSAMSKRDGRVEVQFTLAGHLDDPNFSLNEDATTRVASALTQTLGVSVGGVVEGVGRVIKGLLGR